MFEYGLDETFTTVHTRNNIINVLVSTFPLHIDKGNLFISTVQIHHVKNIHILNCRKDILKQMYLNKNRKIKSSEFYLESFNICYV